MKRPLTECEKCQGTGTVKLRKKLAQTLAVIVKRPNLTSTELHKLFGHDETLSATNNRLYKLVKAGLITKAKVGAVLRYAPVKGGGK